MLLAGGVANVGICVARISVGILTRVASVVVVVAVVTRVLARVARVVVVAVVARVLARVAGVLACVA